MNKPAKEPHEDDASGEARFQRGVTLLDTQKHERETEEMLRLRMFRSLWSEWMLWVGLVLGVMSVNLCSAANVGLFSIVACIFVSIMFMIGAADSAATKRSQAILDWIEYQKTRPSR